MLTRVLVSVWASALVIVSACVWVSVLVISSVIVLVNVSVIVLLLSNQPSMRELQRSSTGH